MTKITQTEGTSIETKFEPSVPFATLPRINVCVCARTSASERRSHILRSYPHPKLDFVELHITPARFRVTADVNKTFMSVARWVIIALPQTDPSEATFTFPRQRKDDVQTFDARRRRN